LAVAALAALVLPAYALLVGGDVPVARAAFTAVVAAWGLTLDLRADAANLLAAAALVLVTERPGCAAEPGFQLSFAATLGLVALTGRLRPLRAWPLRLDLAWAASLAAQLAVAPVLADQFQRLPLAGLLLNAVAVPLSALLLGLGLACVAASWLSAWLAARIGELAWIAAHALWRSAELSHALPWLDRDVGPPAAWVVALHVAALVALSRGGLGPRAAAGLCVSCFVLVVGPGPQADGRLHLTLVDVGQGQCAVLRTPGGGVLVVDAGGAFEGGADLGRVAVAPYLRSLGISRIDVLALSHAHPDHSGGLPHLMRRFEVAEVWEGLAPRDDPQYAAFDLAARQLPRRAVRAGVTWERDGVRVRVLWPRPSGRPPLRVRNDDSLVLEAEFAGQRFLLTGDVERVGESGLEGRASAVSVPHHGSRTSSSAGWLARARPRVALLSVGRRNRFGHPHPEVLERYLALGSLVARTDRDGTVTLCADGATLWLASTREGWHAALR
jgi:competence protein ComEC